MDYYYLLDKAVKIFLKIIDFNINDLISKNDLQILARKFSKIVIQDPIIESNGKINKNFIINALRSLSNEMLFILNILEDKKSVQILENNAQLKIEKNIIGDLDFLVDDNFICEVTGINEIDGYYYDPFNVDKGPVDVSKDKENLPSQLKQKLEGQIQKFLDNNKDLKVNLIFYLPDSFDKAMLFDCIAGEECVKASIYTNGCTTCKTIRRNYIVKKKNNARIERLFELLNEFADRVKVIFIHREKIYYLLKNELKEDKNIFNQLIK